METFLRQKYKSKKKSVTYRFHRRLHCRIGLKPPKKIQQSQMPKFTVNYLVFNTFKERGTLFRPFFVLLL